MSSFYLHSRGPNVCSNGPGAIVKKITNEKSIDISPKIIIIIIVKRNGKEQNKKTKSSKKVLTNQIKSVIIKIQNKELKKKGKMCYD